jgi:hypothetical protein
VVFLLGIAIFGWLTVAMGVVLLGISEYYLWFDLSVIGATESFRQVGQWGVLASTVFLFGGVLLTMGDQIPTTSTPGEEASTRV